MQIFKTFAVYIWYKQNQVSRSATMKNERNKAQYDCSLVNCGSTTFWFSDKVLKSWNHTNRDFPLACSDTAMETLLIICEIFHLTHRSTEGFGRNIFSLLGVQDTLIPDYTSCKRSKTLNVLIKVCGKCGPFNILVDSTGLKVYGEGEWKVRNMARTSAVPGLMFTSQPSLSLNRSVLSKRLPMAHTMPRLFQNFRHILTARSHSVTTAPMINEKRTRRPSNIIFVW
jgi:hypothetical protein